MRRLIPALLLCCCALAAQPRTETRVTFGYAGFLDESTIHHVAAGASARLYLTRRFSVEPEILYLRESRRHHDWLLVPNVAFDLTRPDARVTPYVIGGIGLMHSRQLTGAGFYSFQTATWSAGMGAKIFLSRRVFVAPEFRLGMEPLVRATASIGFVLSR